MDKIQKIEKYIKTGEGFLGKNLTYENPQFEAWNNSVLRFISRQYGEKSSTYSSFNSRMYGSLLYLNEASHKELNTAFEYDLKAAICELEYIKEEIEDDEITIEEGSRKEREENNSSKELHQPVIINNIYNNISNINEIKSNIENNSNINDNDKKELIEQLRKLEDLQNSNKSKNEKWRVAKDIIKFVIDKGVDVAIMYLPQIWKALQW